MYFDRKNHLWSPFFISPKTSSLSIQYLYLQGFSYTSEELHNLFYHTINLKNLSIDIEHNYDYQIISQPFLSLKKLKIFVDYSSYVTSNLLKHMPNLIDLTIELYHIIIDGNQWKELIENNLPNLKQFQLKMEFYLNHNNLKEERIEELINSFSHSFWIIQHQWYIQCHWSAKEKSSSGYLYTLPYSFKDFRLKSNMEFKSTYPNNEIIWSYDYVENLSYRNSDCQFIRFNYLKNLKIQLPFDEVFWLIIPNLNRLLFLEIKLSNNDNNIDHDQFERLIQQTTSLYSLTLNGGFICYWKTLLQLKNVSIRRLHLYQFGCFNRENLENFIHSSLGSRCEILFIKVDERKNILYLVNNMKNLRVLNIRSLDDRSAQKDREFLGYDELIYWLKDRLPNNWIIQRGKIQLYKYIQLWIR